MDEQGYRVPDADSRCAPCRRHHCTHSTAALNVDEAFQRTFGAGEARRESDGSSGEEDARGGSGVRAVATRACIGSRPADAVQLHHQREERPRHPG